MTGIIGILAILAASFLFSEDRAAIKIRTVAVGLLLQIVLALCVLRGDLLARPFEWIPISLPWCALIVGVVTALLIVFLRVPMFQPARRMLPAKPVFLVYYALLIAFLFKFNLIGQFFEGLKNGVGQLLIFSREGSTFVFGAFGSSGQFTEVFGPALGETVGRYSTIFAFQILPTIVFVASLFGVLYHMGVMQPIVRGLAVAMSKTMAASGAESLDVAANIFMGQTEAPLTILPYLPDLTRSELFTIMVSGMAHTSAGILLAYVAVSGVDARHLLTAIVMTAPGSIMLAKMWVPERGIPKTAAGNSHEKPAGSAAAQDRPVNVIDAAARGASNGLSLALNVAAMLIAFISLIALFNGILGLVRGSLLSWTEGLGFLNSIAVYFPERLEQVFGWVFAPAAWMIGVPWVDAVQAGNLLGTKLALNEFVAFVELGKIRTTLAPATVVILSYALCGFANLSSIAIQVGGIGGLIPGRRAEMAALGYRSVIVGTLASLMAAAIAGILTQL